MKRQHDKKPINRQYDMKQNGSSAYLSTRNAADEASASFTASQAWPGNPSGAAACTEDTPFCNAAHSGGFRTAHMVTFAWFEGSDALHTKGTPVSPVFHQAMSEGESFFFFPSNSLSCFPSAPMSKVSLCSEAQDMVGPPGPYAPPTSTHDDSRYLTGTKTSVSQTLF